jgi:hypothetical protein
VVEMGFREVKREFAELHIPEPGKRITYCGCVIKVERFIPRVKPFKVRGIIRYGAVQIILPKEAVDKPVYAIVYVLSESEKWYPRTPLIKVT